MFKIFFNPHKILKYPLLVLIQAIFITLISTVIAIYIFPKQFISIGILVLITIGFMPIFVKLFTYNSYIFNYNKSFFNRHKHLFLVFTFFFLGICLTYILLFFILNPSTQALIFELQLSELSFVNTLKTSLTGYLTNMPISPTFKDIFYLILNNNIGVAIRAIILSLFYGAGALFLLAWNASILGVYVASEVVTTLVASNNFMFILSGIGQSIYNLFGFIPHGMPEILAYFVVSFAGALLVRDFIKGVFNTEFKYKALQDIFLLLFFAFILLVVGALIEASYFFM